VSYHTLARDFLRNLCQRLTEDAARAAQPPVAPATPSGGALPIPVPAPAPPAAALDPGPYCAAGERWTQYLTRPPVVQLVSRRARGGRPAVIKLSVSKPSNVTLRVRRGGRTVIVLGGNLGSGVRSLRWPRPPRSAGRYTVLVHAQDLTGRSATGEATLKLLRARGGKS
jgi:hypothetical protein